MPDAWRGAGSPVGTQRCLLRELQSRGREKWRSSVWSLSGQSSGEEAGACVQAD